MNEIQKVFASPEFGELRVKFRDGQPWFCAVDVCRALDIANPANALTRLDEDEKGIDSIYTLRGDQKMWLVSEQGLYSLAFGSRKQEAKTFRRWVTHEVLPSINRTGQYVAPGAAQIIPQRDGTAIVTAAFFKQIGAKLEELETQVREVTAENDKNRKRAALAISWVKEDEPFVAAGKAALAASKCWDSTTVATWISQAAKQLKTEVKLPRKKKNPEPWYLTGQDVLAFAANKGLVWKTNHYRLTEAGKTKGWLSLDPCHQYDNGRVGPMALWTQTGAAWLFDQALGHGAWTKAQELMIVA